MRIGSLFAGMGGFDLAAESLGWSTAWVSEIDPFACAVLARHFPNARNLGDITAIDWTQVEPVDILCGGWPCQPASLAGKRGGQSDMRWLWPEFRRAVRDLRPRYIVGENVSGFLSLDDYAEYPSDRCVCGWPRRWRGVHLDSDEEGDGVLSAVRHGDEREGALDAGTDADRVRRLTQDVQARDVAMGGGVALDDVGAVVARCIGALAAASSPQGASGVAGPAVIPVVGGAAEDGQDADAPCLDDGGACGSGQDSRGDDGAEPEGADRGLRPEAGDCPSCGRRMGDEPTRHLHGGLYQVLGDLAALGYRCEWGRLSASECGAPHQRSRIFIVGYADRGRREQRHAEQRHGVDSDPRQLPVGDPTERGRGTGPGEPVRRVAGGCEGVGHAGGAGCEERESAAEPGRTRHAAGERGRLGDWRDAVPYRGADGTVRLIPAGAVDDGSRRRLEAGAILDGEESGEREGLDALGRGDGLSPNGSAEAKGPRPEPSLRALADGIPDRLAGRDRGGEEAEPWPTVTVTSQAQHADNPTPGQTGGTTIKRAVNAFAGIGGSLWHVTESEPGRVAKLRAIGNAVVPAWVVAGPFARILEIEAGQ